MWFVWLLFFFQFLYFLSPATVDRIRKASSKKRRYGPVEKGNSPPLGHLQHSRSTPSGDWRILPSWGASTRTAKDTLGQAALPDAQPIPREFTKSDVQRDIESSGL